MRKRLAVVFGIMFCLLLPACTAISSQPNADREQPNIEIEDSGSSGDTQVQTQGRESAVSELDTEATERKLNLTVDGQEIGITLYDTPAANALYDMLPLELAFEEFNGVEKIAYIDHELPTEGEPDGCDPDVGDLCLYAPWGNLSIFYNEFGYSDALVRLGRIDSGVEFIGSMDHDFSATLERAE